MESKSKKKRLNIKGRVVRGLGIGKGIGFPTMNLHPKKMPKNFKFGIYAVRVKSTVGVFAGALYFGPRKTHNAPISLEVYCIGLEKNMYGRTIQVEFIKRLRAPKKFATIGALKKAIKSDILETKKLIKVEHKG